MAMTQAESYEPFWAAHRDNWRAVTPADVWGLEEDRTFQPPSKAHEKRIRRFRAPVTAAEPLRGPGLDSSGARADVNRRAKIGAGVAALCKAADAARR